MTEQSAHIKMTIFGTSISDNKRLFTVCNRHLQLTNIEVNNLI